MKQEDRLTAEGFLFTDQYQLTMAQLYFHLGLHEKTVLFDHFFRSYPDYGGHQAGYCISAGLEWLVNWMKNAHCTEKDIEYLRQQSGRGGKRTFSDDFLTWLRRYGNFEAISMRAIPEGRVVHPNVPLTIIEGPIGLAQILETSLLNHLNFQTLIATKAARIFESGQGRLLLEFGLRRGSDCGANAATRAALIGGADFSSNVGVSHILGLSPKGTHAHSMVQLFMALGEGELEAFRAYSEVYPDDCLLLVDTIDTLESGIPNAIKVFEELRRKGHEPVGIRLDSGDLAFLSLQAAKMLDQAGFPDTTIVLSSNLDEMVIWQILTQIREEASRNGLEPDHVVQRLAFGVGTRLIVSWGEPALGGVYKLVAVCDEGDWKPAIKISDSPDKTPNPGHKNVWRIYDRRNKANADLLTLNNERPFESHPILLHHPTETTKFRTLSNEEVSKVEPLLIDVLEEGKLVYNFPDIRTLRKQRKSDVSRLDAGVRRLINPHIYHVSLSQSLWKLKRQLTESTFKPTN
ncbi:MAG: nicotinate phosphoribosyltransferase [Anaerolineales bacterium]|nr:nicotinate phosphoribosyltransferase [Anaerolineales bacterium]